MKDPEHVKILVVGDIMLDRYIIGEVSRISPEAPVPIVNVSEEYHTLGGCGNVVKNIRELGAQVDCLASIGNDPDSNIVQYELEKVRAGNLLSYSTNRTTVKERIISDQRQVQMLRIDRETPGLINHKKLIKMLDNIEDFNYDMIVVSDYAKGIISEKLMQYLKTKNVKIIVDPKPINGYMYNGVYMITPNENEWGAMKFSSAYNLTGVDYFLITKGKDGMTLMKSDYIWDIGSEPVEIYNVSGCGDVVISIMAVCLSMAYNPLISAKIANKCAGYAATLAGTSVIPKKMFLKYSNEIIRGSNKET